MIFSPNDFDFIAITKLLQIYNVLGLDLNLENSNENWIRKKKEMYFENIRAKAKAAKKMQVMTLTTSQYPIHSVCFWFSNYYAIDLKYMSLNVQMTK